MEEKKRKIRKEMEFGIKKRGEKKKRREEKNESWCFILGIGQNHDLTSIRPTPPPFLTSSPWKSKGLLSMEEAVVEEDFWECWSVTFETVPGYRHRYCWLQKAQTLVPGLS